MGAGQGRLKVYLLAVGLLWCVGHGSAAFALDCVNATSKVDKAVCLDGHLTAADAKLNEDYGELMKVLSPAAQSMLRADQRAWLTYRATACGFTQDGDQPGDMRCLSRQFLRRDERLLAPFAHQRSSQRYTFFVRSTYGTTPNPSGGLPYWAESSIPQIDHKSSMAGVSWADAEAWNTLIAKRIGALDQSSLCAGGKGDIYREPHVLMATALMISVSMDRDDTCHGGRAALIIVRGSGSFNGLPQDHFMSQTQYNIVMMGGDVHELEPGDLFSSGGAWSQLLTERLEQEVQKQARDHNEDWHPSAEAMRAVAIDPSNWVFGSDAFRIRVNQSALSADEFIGGFTVSIPWNDLQAVLSFKGKRILNSSPW
ncbi:lysozyme inhibitor LprI family protein [Dyella sp. C11]|uniref:lysozyme inhibitor LprI family protein n=1 Tax=Dyella sp. C11 TaxID=2126991 RepID=UPI000D658643|nr:lysozyme inhibitor LprI family protein [Dyella sp. C11]